MRLCAKRGVTVFHLRFAEPLYEAQASVYAAASRSLPDFYSQDGELLNFLGMHMRRINPSALIDRFARSLGQYEEEAKQNQPEGPHLILCDDARFTEADFLVSRGFKLIEIFSTPELCLARRATRGDLTLGRADHPTEQNGDLPTFDLRIANEKSLEVFRSAIEDLLLEHL